MLHFMVMYKIFVVDWPSVIAFDSTLLVAFKIVFQPTTKMNMRDVLPVYQKKFCPDLSIFVFQSLI